PVEPGTRCVPRSHFSSRVRPRSRSPDSWTGRPTRSPSRRATRRPRPRSEPSSSDEGLGGSSGPVTDRRWRVHDRRDSVSVRRMPGRRPHAPSGGDAEVSPALRLAAGYVWRIALLLVAVYLLFVQLARVEAVAVAVFVALVASAILYPLTRLL